MSYTGTTGNDTITVTGPGNFGSVYGDAGDDLLIMDLSNVVGNIRTYNSGGSVDNALAQEDPNYFGIGISSFERINVTTGAGDDYLYLFGGDDVVSSGAGNDEVYTNLGRVVIDGGSGKDYWHADVSAYSTGGTIDLSLAGIQAFYGGSVRSIEQVDLLLGSGNDTVLTLVGTAGVGLADRLDGGAGNDTFRVGGGADAVFGGIGDDLLIIDYSLQTAAIVTSYSGGRISNELQGAAEASVGLSGIERIDIRTGSGNDQLYLSTGRDVVASGSGNDVIDTRTGVAVVDGGGGNDLWRADLSASGVGGTLALALTATQNFYGGSVTNIESVDLVLGSGNDTVLTLVGTAGAGLADRLDGGAGNDTFRVGGGADSIIGGIGDDLLIIDYSLQTAAIVTSYSGGRISNELQGAAEASVGLSGIERIEIRTGSGNDQLYLSVGRDVVASGSGDDVIDTRTGSAVVDGGAGRDLWTADFSTTNAAVVLDISKSGAQGFLGGSVINIERLNLTLGSGNDVVTTLTGSAGRGNNDVIDGGAGNDVVRVGGGSDSVGGGAGTDDRLIIDFTGAAGNFTTAYSGGLITNELTGLDLVQVGQSGFEHIEVTGSSGNDSFFTGNGSDILNGAAGSDDLTANGGDDLLDGGTGADTMSGGLGDDRYIVDDEGDVIVEYGDQGVDNVESSISYTLGLDIENLSLSGMANTNATGNATANTLTGSAAANVLNGLAGADTMSGLNGNDTYYVDNVGDTVVEVSANGGTDRVFSTVTFNGSVASSVGVENITLTGSAAINAAGNALNNTITGNSANNGLNGGKGADTLIGGLGNDTYTIDSTGDVITELAGQGTDTVKSAISFTLSDTLENLTLVSTKAINGIGNAGVNVIIGGDGDNILSGKGGADMLTGGAGSDTFDYNSVTESSYSAYDRITDLTNSDKIDLSGIDANSGLAGNQTFSLVNAFSQHAGEITLAYNASAGFTILSADVNGDGVADMRIVLNGDHHSFTNFAF